MLVAFAKRIMEKSSDMKEDNPMAALPACPASYKRKFIAKRAYWGN